MRWELARFHAFEGILAEFTRHTNQGLRSIALSHNKEEDTLTLYLQFGENQLEAYRDAFFEQLSQYSPEYSALSSRSKIAPYTITRDLCDPTTLDMSLSSFIQPATFEKEQSATLFAMILNHIATIDLSFDRTSAPVPSTYIYNEWNRLGLHKMKPKEQDWYPERTSIIYLPYYPAEDWKVDIDESDKTHMHIRCQASIQQQTVPSNRFTGIQDITLDIHNENHVLRIRTTVSSRFEQKELIRKLNNNMTSIMLWPFFSNNQNSFIIKKSDNPDNPYQIDVTLYYKNSTFYSERDRVWNALMELNQAQSPTGASLPISIFNELTEEAINKSSIPHPELSAYSELSL